MVDVRDDFCEIRKENYLNIFNENELGKKAITEKYSAIASDGKQDRK